MIRYQYIGPDFSREPQLRKHVAEAMETRGNVVSASGRTATMAIEWCEERGEPYTLKSNGDRMFYYVEKEA